jgi:hypothetical protein
MQKNVPILAEKNEKRKADQLVTDLNIWDLTAYQISGVGYL